MVRDLSQVRNMTDVFYVFSFCICHLSKHSPFWICLEFIFLLLIYFFSCRYPLICNTAILVTISSHFPRVRYTIVIDFNLFATFFYHDQQDECYSLLFDLWVWLSFLYIFRLTSTLCNWTSNSLPLQRTWDHPRVVVFFSSFSFDHDVL